MFEIWFGSSDMEQKWCIKVKGLEEAQEVWDRLWTRFLMMSTRP
jgi:hypothetical protein